MHGITTIELGGEKKIIAINMHCLIFLSKELKCNPDEIDEKIREVCTINPLRGLTYIIYCGLLGYLESEAVFLHDITLKQVSTWVGDADSNEFKSVWDTFSDVMAIPKATQEQIDEYAKKAEEKIKANMTEAQIAEYDKKVIDEKKKLSWQSIFEHAVISIGIPPKEFYSLTLYEYRCLIHRHIFQNAKDWGHTRLLSFTLLKVNSAKENNLTLNDYMPLITDFVEPPKPELTPEQKEDMRKLAMDRLAIINSHQKV